MTAAGAGTGMDSVPANAAAGPFHAQWAARARELLLRGDARLLKRYGQEVDIDRLLALRARLVDDLLRRAWHECIPEGAPLALIAVGGYGRGELFPRSDIDLLVLAEPDAQHGSLHHGLNSGL